MARFSQEWLNDLISQTDIVSIVGETVELKRKGNRWWGNCPFHSEKTSSFNVQSEKNFFYCFGCHTGGNVIQFLMKKDGMSFVEAVEYLARKNGVNIPDFVDNKAGQDEYAKKVKIYEINKEAARFFYDNLKKDQAKQALQYLSKRRIMPKTAVKFGLGYALDSWDALKNHLLSKGFKEIDIISAGLVNNKNGKSYDVFRNRLMFPIIDISKQIVGFGARCLGDEKPKYLNTNDTLAFNKRRQLYGLSYVTKNNSPLLVVEGYMDVIAVWQSGIENVVASLGTAFTNQQAKLIKRYSENVYICFDGDSAGQSAMLRSVDVFQQERLKVFVVKLPENKDPDDFINLYGKDAFLELVDNALSLNAFKIETIVGRYNLKKEDERIECANEACNFIKTLSPIEQEEYYRKLSDITGFSVEALSKQGGIKKKKIVEKPKQNNIKKIEVDKKRLQYESIILKSLVENRNFLELVTNDLFEIADFKNFFEILQQNQEDEIAILINKVQDPSLITYALSQEIISDNKLVFLENVRELQKLNYLQEIEKLNVIIYDQKTTPKQRRECMERIQKINSLLIK